MKKITWLLLRLNPNGTAVLQALADGWEPFAVGEGSIWFRKLEETP